MAWQKKEKPLTPEEAIAEAKKALAPFWFNSEPLLAGLKTETGTVAIPLGSDFVGRPWIFFFLDPGEYSGENAIRIAREWYKRYHNHKLGLVVFLKPSPVGIHSVTDLVKKFQLQLPVAIDHEHLFEQAFKIKKWPALVFQSTSAENGILQEVLNIQGISWPEGTEEKVQAVLREADPGLALPLALPLKQGVSEEGRIDFGTLVDPPVGVRLSGNWTQGEDFIRTQDPQALLEISLSSSFLSLVARSGLETQPSKISAEILQDSSSRVGAGTLSPENVGEQTSFDDNGRAVLKIQQTGLYHFLRGLPAGRRTLRLGFPDAENIPVLLHGLRFGR